MQTTKLKSALGPRTVLTLTDFEKRVLLSLLKKASIPAITRDITSEQPGYDQWKIGHVLQTMIRGLQ
jgi:hypothetical protein